MQHRLEVLKALEKVSSFNLGDLRQVFAKDPDTSVIDYALGLPTKYNEYRGARRAAVADFLLPDVLKQAEEGLLKVETPKTLHGRKYDRRMKFETVIQRSTRPANVLKTADLLPFLRGSKQAADPDFNFNGATGREGVMSWESMGEQTDPLPIDEPQWYNMPNKPVMDKLSLQLPTSLLKWRPSRGLVETTVSSSVPHRGDPKKRTPPTLSPKTAELLERFLASSGW